MRPFFATETKFVKIASAASLAQLAEHALRKRMVAGSIPAGCCRTDGWLHPSCEGTATCDLLLHARDQPPTHTGNPTDVLLQALTANAVAADAPYRLRI